MPLNSDIKFQKALALAASASNRHEAEAAEQAARRIMQQYNIDPTDIPDASLYSRTNFSKNVLLMRLRDEWRKQHPRPLPEPKPPLPEPEREPEPLSETDYLDMFEPIPFNIHGFTKHARRKPPFNADKSKSTGKKRVPMVKADQARLIVRPLIERGERVNLLQLEKENPGISHWSFDLAVYAERVRREDPIIDPHTLPLTAQEKLAAAIRQHKHKLDAEFEQRVRDEVRKQLDEFKRSLLSSTTT
jgi:hypothetical protein